MGWFTSIFSTGVMGTVERVALEAIETGKEKAEASALFIKTLDPNGIMRRELSRFACKAYGFYLVATVLLIFFYAGFGFFYADSTNAETLQLITTRKEIIGDSIRAITELFLPITTAWGTIVSASFGVNYANVKAGK